MSPYLTLPSPQETALFGWPSRFPLNPHMIPSDLEPITVSPTSCHISVDFSGCHLSAACTWEARSPDRSHHRCAGYRADRHVHSPPHSCGLGWGGAPDRHRSPGSSFGGHQTQLCSWWKASASKHRSWICWERERVSLFMLVMA